MGGVGTAILALISIFLPGFLLIIGALPFWDSLRVNKNVQGILAGINSAVIGILLAALYNPIWTSTILSAGDFALAAVLFSMLIFWNFQSWSIVIIGAACGIIIRVFRV
jgi:chromate transporter